MDNSLSMRKSDTERIRSNSVRQDIYIKNEDKEDYSNFSKTSRCRTSIQLINNEGNFEEIKTKNKNEYIYSTLYNPIAYNRLKNNEKKELIMR